MQQLAQDFFFLFFFMTTLKSLNLTARRIQGALQPYAEIIHIQQKSHQLQQQ